MNMLTNKNLPTLLDEFFGDWGTAATKGSGAYSPGVEVRKSEGAYQVIAHLPGATRENVEIEAKDGFLVIQGKVATQADESYKTLFSELPRLGEFKRSLRIDDRSFDLNRVEARLEHGVLTVTLPIAEAAKPKKIEVN